MIPSYQCSQGAQSFIDRHLMIVRPMAGRLARQLCAAHEVEDVTHAGMLGLVKAAVTYNPEKGTERFWAWACIRREILSSYAHGKDQHSGSDAYTYTTRRRPLNEAIHVAVAEDRPHVEEDLPTYPVLTERQQQLLRLIYEEGMSERRVAREHLLGHASHANNKSRTAPIGLRRVVKEHRDALQTLKQVLHRRAA